MSNDEDMTSAEFDAAWDAGQPVEVVGRPTVVAKDVELMPTARTMTPAMGTIGASGARLAPLHFENRSVPMPGAVTTKSNATALG